MFDAGFVERCEKFISMVTEGSDAGHDISHIRRVVHNAIVINREDMLADNDLVILCSMFHDTFDHKFTEKEGLVKDKVIRFLYDEGVDRESTGRIIYVAENVSFSKGESRGVIVPELAVVMDADRLDAMGAIGIARAFTYGGFRNRPLYGLTVSGTTIGHFYEKLLLLKDLMNTETGKKMALERHLYMIEFLKQFERETGVEPATLSLGS